MNLKQKNIVKTIVVAGGLFLPVVAFAQNAIQKGMQGIANLFPQTGIAGSSTLNGPNGLIYNIIATLLLLAGGVGVLVIIVGGFQYLTSAGNEEQAEKGKKTLINAVI